VDLNGSEASDGGLGLWVWDTSGAGRWVGAATCGNRLPGQSESYDL